MGRPKKVVEVVDGPTGEPEAMFASKSEMDAVRSDISKVTDAILALSEKLDAQKPEQKSSPVVIAEDEGDPARRLPKTYRQIIDELLSHEFPASVEWRTDGNFELSIEVPLKYSNATPSYLSVYKKDMRVRVIPNALAENGVREYVQSVAKNLGEVIMNNVKQAK